MEITFLMPKINIMKSLPIQFIKNASQAFASQIFIYIFLLYSNGKKFIEIKLSIYFSESRILILIKRF